MVLNGMTERPSERTLTGRVGAVNEKGLKFEGAREWLNVSKFAVGVVLPERGQTVSVGVDKAGFLRSCRVIDPSDVVVEPNGALAVARPRSSDREHTITRLAVLKAAAEFGASRPDLKSGDVLRIAESWVRWIELPAEPDDDLTDAF